LEVLLGNDNRAKILELDVKDDKELVELLEIILARIQYRARSLEYILKLSPQKRRSMFSRGKVKDILLDILAESAIGCEKSGR
jgi:hypothetical protein